MNVPIIVPMPHNASPPRQRDCVQLDRGVYCLDTPGITAHEAGLGILICIAIVAWVVLSFWAAFERLDNPRWLGLFLGGPPALLGVWLVCQ